MALPRNDWDCLLLSAPYIGNDLHAASANLSLWALKIKSTYEVIITGILRGIKSQWTSQVYSSAEAFFCTPTKFCRYGAQVNYFLIVVPANRSGRFVLYLCVPRQTLINAIIINRYICTPYARDHMFVRCCNKGSCDLYLPVHCFKLVCNGLMYYRC